ncbi:MAG TPA: hypothetical protein DIW81_17050 [Planctomycetaceae bacterium]|nr:hypothetical protein [Rubinisphaera sp.]HCS53273.1 hypothetical protein [Planctomycetaceae bacterium]
MHEVVQRWRENEPLSENECQQMRIAFLARVILVAFLLVVLLFCLSGCRTCYAESGARQLIWNTPSTAPASVGENSEESTPQSQQPESFDGVTIVVAVKRLTEFAPELRAKAAVDADRVLRNLAAEKLNGRVTTRLIAEVAEVNVFRNFEVASMASADPVLIHVLVPRANTGLVQSTIRAKLAEIIRSHYLDELRKARLMVTFERLDPDKYQVALDTASRVEPPAEPLPVPPAPIPNAPDPIRNPQPENQHSMIITMLTAWLTERSKLFAKIISLYESHKA